MAMEDLALAEKAKSTQYLPRQIASQKRAETNYNSQYA